MKKITLLLAGLMISGVASAAPTILNGSGNIIRGDCTLLNEDVAINLSSGVVGAADCSPTVIALAVCHSAGKVTSRTAYLRDVTTQDAEGNDVVTPTSCVPVEDDTECLPVPVVGPAMPVATTERGTVNTQYPGGNTCTTTVASGAATDNL